MPLSFADNVPRWLRVVIRRWVRIIGYVDWAVRVEVVSDEELRLFTGTPPKTEIHLLGGAEVWARYLQITVKFREGEGADTLEDYAAHELLHGHYDPLFELFDRLWDGRRKASRKDARKELDDLIDKLIQRHVRQLQRAQGKG